MHTSDEWASKDIYPYIVRCFAPPKRKRKGNLQEIEKLTQEFVVFAHGERAGSASTSGAGEGPRFITPPSGAESAQRSRLGRFLVWIISLWGMTRFSVESV
ncbi:hypothetical protein RRG08_002322 [Elysia crispata]|uniref:Uncharacterized protein n=1 Tax=Elysia crispata TaxID=231223 RepID=A0AAE0ZB22_9GAST|nr:hypothetical protein RRG08_002322 [Elysia crispata]